MGMIDALLNSLAKKEWLDVSDVETDPDSVECYAYGIHGSSTGDTVYLLSRYESDIRFALITLVKGRPDMRAVTTDQIRLEFLWDQIIVDN